MGLFSKRKNKKERDTQEPKDQIMESDSWICPVCETKNPITSISCKDCGHYR